jgi:uncharacterized membrane-anchored protein YitT (DUF2179 family)
MAIAALSRITWAAVAISLTIATLILAIWAWFVPSESRHKHTPLIAALIVLGILLAL